MKKSTLFMNSLNDWFQVFKIPAICMILCLLQFLLSECLISVNISIVILNRKYFPWILCYLCTNVYSNYKKLPSAYSGRGQSHSQKKKTYFTEHRRRKLVHQWRCHFLWHRNEGVCNKGPTVTQVLNASTLLCLLCLIYA